ncbi:MAG: glycoside hydrolase family 31 protein [Anaerolineae bacterium]|nr:glycoside hydrolase family 31 protein [Anaerolineae bacterium]
MSAALRVTEHEQRLTLSAAHSTLEFATDGSGFYMLVGEHLVMRTGQGWSAPCGRLCLWQVEGDEALLTFYRGTHGYGRLRVRALPNGWEFAWDQPTRDTFDLSVGVHWYGQGELVHQRYPLDQLSLWEAPLLTWDNGATGLGNIQTPAWLCATGVALLVTNATDSLQVGFNAPPSHVAPPSWDLSAAQAPAAMRPPLASPESDDLLTLHDPNQPLNYLILVGDHVRAACQALINALGKPERTPPEAYLRQPIWTTWARYKTAINQDVVLRFAEEIRAHGFAGGTFGIDDKWQRAYGDNALDPERFPDPKGMVRALNQLGFNVTLWVHPFFVPESQNTQEAIRRGYLVKQPERDEPYPVLWWQGLGYLLDVSNPEALAWYADKLRALQNEIGLAGYKFDAGEANYLPADGRTYAPIHRNEYSKRWTAFAAEHFPYCEVRTGWFSQTLPVLFRQWDRFSTWGYDNGLASVISTALMLSATGYPFTLPDMIGGNAYGDLVPDKELLIRWTQASALMLAMQFSIAPWDFDAETVTICRKYTDLHVSLAEERLAAAQRAVQDGTPVVRPLWWDAPEDIVALRVADQYLMGKYLAAPVITPQTTARDVYLPRGTWRDYWTGEYYASSGMWLRSYPAPLDVLPLFVRADEEQSAP